MFTHVKLADTGGLVAKKVWMNYTKKFRRLGEFHSKDKVAFRAKIKSRLRFVEPYPEPPKHKYWHFYLSFPTKIHRIPSGIKRSAVPIQDNQALMGLYYATYSLPLSEF